MHEPASWRRAIARLARTGLCAGALLVAATLVAADGPDNDIDRNAYRDLQLMVHARKALHQDESLAPLNLGVTVRDGVATIRGAVPSADLILKAAKRVENVQGILGVRNQLYVALPVKELDLSILSILAPERTLRESASPGSTSGRLNSLTDRVEYRSEGRRERSTAGPQPGIESPGIPGTFASNHVPTQGTPTSQSRTDQSAVAVPDLAAVIDRLRRADVRFRFLRIDVKGSTVYVLGSSDQGADVMAFARILSHLAGVTRVVTKTDDGPAP